jgi:hypothetical protein
MYTQGVSNQEDVCDMNRQEIERSFVAAGWEITGRQDVIVGNADGISILAYEGSAISAEDPAFELLDRERDLAHWVRVVPTPRIAAELLGAHGAPPL